MATLNELANEALEQLFVLSAGETPAPDEHAAVLSIVQRLIVSLPEIGGGRQLVDVESNTSCEPAEDTRVVVTSSGVTITPPSAPRNGARFGVIPIGVTVSVSAGSRYIQGSTLSLSVTTPTIWTYDPSAANWVKVTDLASTDQSPWPAWLDQHIAVLAARDAAPKVIDSISATLAANIARAEAALRTVFSRPAKANWAAAVPGSVRGSGWTSGRLL